MMSRNYSRPVSTLLIPENVAWLPYVAVAVLVIGWLTHDFIMFHMRKKAKYAHIRETNSVQMPDTNRMNMVGSTDLQFQNGKPGLGDVWTTSTSSSSLSSATQFRHSRDYSPSDDDGDNLDDDVTRKNMDGLPTLGISLPVNTRNSCTQTPSLTPEIISMMSSLLHNAGGESDHQRHLNALFSNRYKMNSVSNDSGISSQSPVPTRLMKNSDRGGDRKNKGTLFFNRLAVSLFHCWDRS